MKTNIYSDPAKDGYMATSRFTNQDLAMLDHVIWDKVINELVNRIADQYMAQEGQTLLAKLDPTAIANMAAIALGKTVLPRLLK